MFTQKFIKIFYSVQEIGLFSLFQNLDLGNASANPKWYLTIPKAISCQYQCVCKILSKYSKRFKSYRHFSRAGRGQNLHKQSKDKIFTNSPRTKSSQTVQGQNLHKVSGDKIKCLILGQSMKFNIKFQLTFLGSCNYIQTFVITRSIYIYFISTDVKVPYPHSCYSNVITNTWLHSPRRTRDWTTGGTDSVIIWSTRNESKHEQFIFWQKIGRSVIIYWPRNM